MTLALRYAVRSDMGLVRSNNEDSVYAGPRLLAVADGMGGHAAGEVASKIVIGTLERLDEDRSLSDLVGELNDAVVDANARIAEAVRRDPGLEGMGTTLTALRFTGSRVGLLHVGDSRAYLLRDGELSQITHDDTYVQYLVDTGKITAEEAKDHPRRSVILRAVRGEEIEPDIAIREARPGDRYLLCSDGLTDVVSFETINDALQVPELQDCADRLVELALRGGGPDNVTVIVADVLESRVGDSLDDMPVIAGAFVDPAAADIPGTDSPAERAAHMSRPKREQPAEQQPPRRRRRWKKLLLALAAVVIVVGGLAAAYAWTQTYYFVGKAGTEVAIFRGVNASFGPLRFYDVAENSDLLVNELDQSSRSQVVGGIAANSLSDARQIVQRLERDHMLPLCPAPSPTPSATPSGTALDSPTPSTGRAATTTPRTTPSATTTPKATTTAKPTTTPATSTATTTAPYRPPRPYIDCRPRP